MIQIWQYLINSIYWSFSSDQNKRALHSLVLACQVQRSEQFINFSSFFVMFSCRQRSPAIEYSCHNIYCVEANGYFKGRISILFAKYQSRKR